MFPLHDDNPVRESGYVTYVLIALCGLTFLWQQSLGEIGSQQIAYSLGVIPSVLFDTRALPPGITLVPPWLTIVTSMFLHGGFLHLLGNMLYLYIFGNNVEDSMGHGRFVAFYLLCGIAAAFAQSLANPESVIPMIGASGAISGVLGAYLLLFPHARVFVFIPLGFLLYPTRLPASWVLGFWFLVQLYSTVTADQQEGGVAFFAHLGGFVAGMGLILVFRRRGVPLFATARRR